MQETPYWEVGESREYAFFCDRLACSDWYTFTKWVDLLPVRFEQLREFAKTGCATDRTKLGRELIEAWTLYPSDDELLRSLIRSLANGIAWRVVTWVRACDYQIKPDPAVLVLFED